MIERLRLPTQIFVPRSPAHGGRPFAPTPGRFRTPAPGLQGNPKPSGGLWTSTFEGHDEHGWFGWCSSEQPGWPHRFGYLLAPVECRVWVIGGIEDQDEFHGRYAGPLPGKVWEDEWADLRTPVCACLIGWDKVLADADAVWLAAPWTVRMGGSGRWAHTITFYGWDCESTWWGHWMFEGAVKRIALPAVACPDCKGSRWSVEPDYSNFRGIGDGTLEAVYEAAVECPSCKGSGQQPVG